STEAVRKFQRSVEDYLALKGRSTEDEKAVIFAGTYLTGAAKAWYESKRETQRTDPKATKITLAELWTNLQELYIPSTDKSAEYRKWIECKQILNSKIRPVGEFASELEYLRATLP